MNVNALVDYWQYGQFPTTFPLTEGDAQLIADVGWNVVRLLVSWSRIEPEPGRYDDAYLEQVRAAVRLFARHGIRSIVDFHQDAWGPTLAARPGEVCAAGQEPAFGWDGAPGWATLDGGAPRCMIAGVRELSPAVRAAFAAFWADQPGPGGVGVRTRYAAMVGHVAGRFAHEPAVAGYEVMNEPNAFGATELQGLSDLYAATVAAIRAAETRAAKTRAGAFAHLVFFEPSILWSDTDLGVPPPFPHDGGVVFAPHIYRGGLTSGPVQRSDFERARRDAATFGGVPVLVGEWGSGPERAEDPADVYFRTHQQLQDEFHFSATLWTWRESCGDPHKAGDARAGRVPSVWGEFEVDCRTNTVVGPRDCAARTAHPRLRAGVPRPIGRVRVRPRFRSLHRVRARRARARAAGSVVPDAARLARDDHVRRPARRARPDHARRRRRHLRDDDRRRVAPRPVAVPTATFDLARQDLRVQRGEREAQELLEADQHPSWSESDGTALTRYRMDVALSTRLGFMDAIRTHRSGPLTPLARIADASVMTLRHTLPHATTPNGGSDVCDRAMG